MPTSFIDAKWMTRLQPSCRGNLRAAYCATSGSHRHLQSEKRLAKDTLTRLNLFWQKNGWLGLCFVGAALLVFGVAAILTAMAERERSASVETTGTVVALFVFEGSRSSDGTTGLTGYSVHVDYKVDGQEYRSSQGIAKKDFEQFSEGQTVAVGYLPDNPERIWVAPDANTWASSLRFLGWILLPFGLFLVWGPWVVAGQELKNTRKRQH